MIWCSTLTFSIFKNQKKKIRRAAPKQRFGFLKLFKTLHLTIFGRIFFYFLNLYFTGQIFFLNFKISGIWKNCSKTHFFKTFTWVVSIVIKKSSCVYPTHFYLLWTKLIWSIDFMISKKKFFWFSGRIRTFYRKKTYFYEKKNFCRSAVCRDFIAVQMKS
jgi:hypothetical protein